MRLNSGRDRLIVAALAETLEDIAPFVEGSARALLPITKPLKTKPLVVAGKDASLK